MLIIIKLELQIIEFSYRIESFKYSFFPFCVSESNSLENSKTPLYQAFQINVNTVFHIIFTLFYIHDQIGVKLLTRLRLKFSLLIITLNSVILSKTV